MRLPDYQTLQLLASNPAVWNALIPKAAVEFVIHPNGVSYLHATKGWKFVGARRFAVRGGL